MPLSIYQGTGFLNSLINNLPIELHVPGYQYCGPGTKLHERLRRGDPGVNPLDAACKSHDIAYSRNKDLAERHKADKELQEAAWSRFKSKDASFGEKAAAWAVTLAMKTKRKLGMGIANKSKRKQKKKTRPCTATTKNKNKNKNRKIGKVVFKKSSEAIKPFKRKLDVSLKEGSRIALTAAKAAVRDAGGVKRIRRSGGVPRVLPLPKSGGILPLIPIFAGLSALGTLAGGAAGISKAVTSAKEAREKLAEDHRHNRMLEAIALGGKKGSGLYLKPYKKGLGVYLKQQQQSKN